MARVAESMRYVDEDPEEQPSSGVLPQAHDALRRVAAVVARESSPMEIFTAVTQEAVRVLDSEAVGLVRFEPDETATVVAHANTPSDPTPPGTRVALDGENIIVQVFRTRQPARADGWAQATGAIGAIASVRGVRSSVAAPVFADGKLWGAMIAATSRCDPLPDETERRMEHFTALVSTAIANADNLDQLMASRARLVSAGDAARRRVVRDLHDGAQQRLVHTIVALKLAQQALHDDPGRAEAFLGQAVEYAEQANTELRELAHGILPAILTNSGLCAGVDAVVDRLDLPVHVDVPSERFAPEVEANAYFIVAEALTNIVKHARATAGQVKVYVNDGALFVEVRDDGIGGADVGGHGLLGLADRATALGGGLRVDSPSGGGTCVTAILPLRDGR
jgi:signal transduction histidine kinase